MFSGIVADIGTVAAVRPRGAGRTLVVRTAFPLTGEGAIGLGDSIAVMGACLTVEAFEGQGAFVVAAGRETVDRTTLGALTVGSRVHLERALRLDGRLDGHLVAGHVDGVATVGDVREDGESVVLWLELPAGLSRYVAEKGSVAVDGVSLTVNEVAGARFRVDVVPFTAQGTLLGALRPGLRVNIEVDVLARYLERLLGADTRTVDGRLTRERLVALGFAAAGRGPQDPGDR